MRMKYTVAVYRSFIFVNGIDVSDFVVEWEDLTMDWTDGQGIQKVPLEKLEA